jgi:ureidoacrylate peracid hydrolase
MDQTAVLMIDIQNSYIAADGMRDALGRPPISWLEETVAACSGLLAAAVSRGFRSSIREGSAVRPVLRSRDR